MFSVTSTYRYTSGIKTCDNYWHLRDRPRFFFPAQINRWALQDHNDVVTFVPLELHFMDPTDTKSCMVKSQGAMSFFPLGVPLNFTDICTEFGIKMCCTVLLVYLWQGRAV